MIVAGVDIGNQTTEVALVRFEPDQSPAFLAESLVQTTGIKGTIGTLPGVRTALEQATQRAEIESEVIDLVRINEAAPVVAGVAMQAITETTLTDSTLIGHNPETPGGLGLGFGITVALEDLHGMRKPAIAIVRKSTSFEAAAGAIRFARAAGVAVAGAIVESDDGVLIVNRIGDPWIPIVDEVAAVERVPLGQPAAIEVAPIGATIEALCNPYGLATLFGLDSHATARIAPAARALTGLRSAAVIRTPAGDVKERRIEAGTLSITGARGRRRVDTRAGAEAVMREIAAAGPLFDVDGTAGTSAGAMFGKLRDEVAAATGTSPSEVHVRDLLATDLSVPQPVAGGLSNEVVAERAVALAAMVESSGERARRLAKDFADALGIPVEPGGTEADAGIRGALTTPGTGLPLCVVDLGSGSTNVARIDAGGEIEHAHLAGGGAMVDLLIGEELGVADSAWRDDLKRHRVGRAESLFTLRHEDGSVQFLDEPISPRQFGRTLLIHSDGMDVVPGDPPLERVVAVRRQAKRAVFGANIERALTALAPGGNPRFLGFVALIGGSALDFELPGMIAAQLAEYGIVTGTANVRGTLGPRNAVATGLALRDGLLTVR
ncbi:MAG TPA: diol dehydratase reactivase subunit alpha [Thermomicrobiales bacterium]|nr:diol dehydratase reactivase subunit alpha [Thermomicrobiales bacterium]